MPASPPPPWCSTPTDLPEKRQALEIRQRVIGVDNPYTSLSRYSLARYAARRGRRDEALAWLREALDHGLDAGSASGLATQRELAGLRTDARFQSRVEEGRRRAESSRTK